MEKLKVHHGALTQDLIQRIKAFSYSKKEHRLNLTSWSPSVVGLAGPIILYDLNASLQEEVKVQLLPVLGLTDTDAYTWEIVYTLGSRFSFIPWHGDDQYTRACTVYLNEQWSRDWAGMFVYEHSPDDFRAIYPEYNKAVILYPPIPHTTTMPSIDAPLRESLQIFVKSKGASSGNQE